MVILLVRKNANIVALNYTRLTGIRKGVTFSLWKSNIMNILKRYSNSSKERLRKKELSER